MTRKRETGGIRKRGAIWWIYYRVDGVRYDESANTGDERAARSLLAQRRREIREHTWQAPGERGAKAKLTVEVYLNDWIARRRTAGIRNVHEEERHFREHVIPVLGAMLLTDVKRVHIRELMLGVRATPKKLQPIAASNDNAPTAPALYASRSVLHIYRTLATAFTDAVLDGILLASPCTLRTRKGELPVKRDADAKWRSEAVYSRDEAEQLISDKRIPDDRRVYYAFGLLAGLRSSEITARRWRDYDVSASPLGKLTVATQADEDGERETKTGDIREVPVHPTFAKVLAEWKLSGFVQLFSRQPTPDDLILPSRQDGRSFRSKKMCERMRQDLERLNMRKVPSPRHAMRATFLSLLEIDGANMGIARRATHAAPSDVVGGYIRIRWDDLCREIAKMKIELRQGAKVFSLPLPKAANDDPFEPSFVPFRRAASDNLSDTRPLRSDLSEKNWRGGRDLNPRPPA